MRALMFTGLALALSFACGCGESRPAQGVDVGSSPDVRVTDGLGPDAPAQDQRAPDLRVADARIVDSVVPDLAPPPDGPAADTPPPNTIGPAGGKAKSADGNAELLVPAGALASAVTFTLAPASGAPAGGVGTAYAIGPASTPFLKPPLVRITYDASKLSGALEPNVRLGRATGIAWSRLGASMVDAVADEVSAIVPGLGVFAAVSGGAQADISKVMVATPDAMTGSAGPVLGAPGGTAPLLGIPLDGQGLPLRGAVLTYLSAKPAALAVDPTAGTLTAKKLSAPPQQEGVLITVKASATVKGTRTVTVAARTKAQVNLVGSFTALGVSAAGEAALPGAQLSVIGAPGVTVLAGPKGALTALPPLSAGTLNILRLVKTPTHVETRYPAVAPTVDKPGQTGSYRIYAASLFPSLVCGVVPWHAGLGAVLITAAPDTAAGWTYHVSSPAALVRYLDSAGKPKCAQESSLSGGRALIVNLEQGPHWVLARRGSTLALKLVQISSGRSVTPVRFK